MDEVECAERVRQMIDARGGGALATIDAYGLPVASYVPIVVHRGRIAIATSLLARHTANLAGFPHASLLVVDELGDDAFARARVTLEVRVHHDEAASAPAHGAWDALQRRFGEAAGVLRTLADFTIFELEPLSGRLILGYASAHDVGAHALGTALT